MQLNKDKMQLEEEIDELKERFDNIVQENDKYKKQMATLTEKLKENSKTIENLNAKILSSIETETKLEDMKNEKKKLSKEIEQKENEIRMQQLEISNIQEALAEAHEANQQVTEKPKYQHKSNDSELKEKCLKLQDQLENLAPHIELSEKYKSQVDELCKANTELRNKFKDLEKDVNKKIDQRLLEHMKTKNLIDSQMINTFLVQYLRHSDDPNIQKQMLVAMSGILNFSDNDKKVIGLIEKSDEEMDNIGAKFIDFILEDQ